MMTLELAIKRLAGARWWLKGFLAACTTDREDAAFSIERQLEDVSEHLAKLEDGKTRTLIAGRWSQLDGRGMRTRIDRDDGGLLIISYAELEKLTDAILRTPTLEDRLLGRDTARRILGEWQAEQDAIEATYDDDVPF